MRPHLVFLAAMPFPRCTRLAKNAAEPVAAKVEECIGLVSSIENQWQGPLWVLVSGEHEHNHRLQPLLHEQFGLPAGIGSQCRGSCGMTSERIGGLKLQQMNELYRDSWTVLPQLL
jgi:hypothetical protein